MQQKPKLEVRQYLGTGKEDYAVFRADKTKPICSGITKAHAEHLKMILKNEKELHETIPPIANWYDYDEIIDVDDSKVI